MYRNTECFLPMVIKAREDKCLDLLMAGRGKWRIIEQDMFGDYPDRPTDWHGIYLFGIYKIYEERDIAIKEELEKALIDICGQEGEDSAYLASLAWSYQLAFENESRAPFKLERNRILESIQTCIRNNKKELLASTKWVYSDDEYPNNLYREIKMLNKYFIKLGVDIFKGIQ